MEHEKLIFLGTIRTFLDRNILFWENQMNPFPTTYLLKLLFCNPLWWKVFCLPILITVSSSLSQEKKKLLTFRILTRITFLFSLIVLFTQIELKNLVIPKHFESLSIDWNKTLNFVLNCEQKVTHILKVTKKGAKS